MVHLIASKNRWLISPVCVPLHLFVFSETKSSSNPLCLSPLLTTPFTSMAFLLVKVCALVVFSPPGSMCFKCICLMVWYWQDKMACHLATLNTGMQLPPAPQSPFFPLGVWLGLINKSKHQQQQKNIIETEDFFGSFFLLLLELKSPHYYLH